MMKLNWGVVSVIALALLAAGCSSSGAGGSSSEMPTVEDQATSTAVVGACGGTTADTVGSGIGGLAFNNNDRAAENVRAGLANYIARRAIEKLAEQSGSGPDKTVSLRTVGDTYILTFTDEVVTNPAGGSAILSGDLYLTYSESGDTITLTASGDIENVVSDWAATVTVGGVTYDEVVDGTWTMSFSGEVSVTVGDDYTSSSVNLAATINGSNIRVTGDASGTATISDFTITVSGSGTDPDDYTQTCSGSVSVVGSGGATETCNVASDCSGCE